MNFLTNLTKEQILQEPVPISNLLENSLYYLASGFDGDIVKHASKNFQSFVFCDYATGEKQLLDQLNSFQGYFIIGNRPVTQEELTPLGWQMRLPPHFDLIGYNKYEKSLKPPFAHWVVYERQEGFDASHGAKRFSLLYIGGEGVATYQAIYWSNKKTAKALAIIQPGTGFGLNWTDFRSENQPLGWMVLNNESGIPDSIYYGGGGNNYDNLNWGNYHMQETIKPYYGGLHPSGEVTVWKK